MAADTKNRTYGKIAGLGNNSKTVNNIKNLTWGKKLSAQQDLPTLQF
jgi:hypothetical protein